MLERKIDSLDIELAVANLFNYRVNLIVPNVSWGMFIHECDLLIISRDNYATEVEIKISKSDLKADQKKKHEHNSRKIKYLYFAIPDYLYEYKDLIPERAGIITVYWYEHFGRFLAVRRRKPQKYSNYKMSERERYDVARLGTMRIWTLKRKLKDFE